MPSASPELIVLGRIATLAGGGGMGWAEAVAIAGGRVVAAGDRAAVLDLAATRTRRLELEPDEVALPGLTDAHVHLADGALGAERVDLAGAATLDEVRSRVAAAHAALSEPDAWLEGGGWDPTVLGRWPTSDDLEPVAPGRRIALWAHDHHALLASRRALAETRIDAATPDPPGGTIRREDAAGPGRVTPTGVLHEHASRLVTERIPPPSAERLDRAIERWAHELLALGLVAVHDMGPLAPDRSLGGAFAAVGRLDAAGRLPIRVHAGIREESLDKAIGRGLRTGDPIGPDGRDGRARARVGWWKRFADGSLGSRTAFLREPYEGSDDRGMALVDPRELEAGIRQATAAGIATAVHAIGDAALDLAIGALAPVTEGGLAAQARIEHAQLVHDDQLPRLTRARIALSMQPYHARSDGPSIASAWGDRARRLGYRWRSAVRSGVRVAFGTDAPVESPDPWPGLAVAIDRTARTLGPAAAVALDPTEALGLGSALRGGCVAPALVAGEPDRGRLEVGHRADLIVLRLPSGGRLDDPSVLATLRPRLVLVDGEVAFEA